MFSSNDYINCSLYKITIQETHLRLSQAWQLLSTIRFSFFKQFYWEAKSQPHLLFTVVNMLRPVTSGLYENMAQIRWDASCSGAQPSFCQRETSLSFCWISVNISRHHKQYKNNSEGFFSATLNTRLIWTSWCMNGQRKSSSAMEREEHLRKIARKYCQPLSVLSPSYEDGCLLWFPVDNEYEILLGKFPFEWHFIQNIAW